MSGTCSTCRHWDRTRIGDGKEPYGRCAQAESAGDPVCGSRPTHPAYAMDASGYHASLRTLPTFGCNQHVELDIASLRGLDGKPLPGLAPHLVALVDAEIARGRQ